MYINTSAVNILNIYDSFQYMHLLMNNKVLLSARKCENQMKMPRA